MSSSAQYTNKDDNYWKVNAWKDLVADQPITYSTSQLSKLRIENKKKWRKYLNILLESDAHKKEWNFEGSENLSIAPFEPHHFKEVLDITLYQFSSFGNNTFHKILNTQVGALRNGIVDCLNHVCLTGLGYVLLDKYNHVNGVFYGWDIRDEPIWNIDKHHINSIKEDEIISAANRDNIFTNNLFEKHRNRVKYGSVFFGEILCVQPKLMGNGWFTKLAINVAIIYGMHYDVYYDFDFQPNRHLYNIDAFNSIDFVRKSILRYDLFYFGDFHFKCDNSNISENFKMLKKSNFKDIANLKKNAYVGCFIIHNSKPIRAMFKEDFIRIYTTTMILRNQQFKIEQQIKKNRAKKRAKKKKQNLLKSKL